MAKRPASKKRETTSRLDQTYAAIDAALKRKDDPMGHAVIVALKAILLELEELNVGTSPIEGLSESVKAMGYRLEKIEQLVGVPAAVKPRPGENRSHGPNVGSRRHKS